MPSRQISRSQALAAWVFGGAVALVILVGSSGGEIRRTAYGDGLIYRYVAGHLTTDLSDIDDVVVERGASLRYGRVGMPAAIWLLGLGQRHLLAWGQAIVVVASTAAVSGAAALLFPRAGPLAAALPFLAPGVALSISGGYAEILALALALWAIIFASRGRWWLASLSLAGAMLTRENAGAITLGLFLWLVLQQQPRAAAIMSLSLLPLAVWYAFVAVRYGHIPVLDPYLRTQTDTVGPPVISPLQSLFDSVSGGALAAAVIHLALGIVAVTLARRSSLGLLAAVASMQLLITGPFAWTFVGDASRTGVFIQVLTLLALVAWLRPTWRDPDAPAKPMATRPPVVA